MKGHKKGLAGSLYTHFTNLGRKLHISVGDIKKVEIYYFPTKMAKTCCGVG